MKKLFTYLGLVLAACLILVACASNKPAEKKKTAPTPTERAKADATILIDTMLGNQVTVFQNSTVKITKPGLKRMSLKNRLQTLLKRRGIHRKKSIRLNTLKAMMPRLQLKYFLSSLRSVVI